MSGDPYLLAGTGTLRNKAGITDPTRLAAFEANATFGRIAQLDSGEVTIPGRWDLDHLLAYHRHIFGDVYDWAGTVRTVDLSKGTTVFAFARYIRPAAAELFADLETRGQLRGLSRPQFLAQAAHVLSEVNALHPAREGNGRTQRAFLGGLAAQAGWRLRWAQVQPDENIAASIAGYQGDEKPLVVLLDRITTRLDPPQAGPGPGPNRQRSSPSPGAARRGSATPTHPTPKPPRPGRDFER